MECLENRVASFSKGKRVKVGSRQQTLKWPHPSAGPERFTATPQTLAEAGFCFKPGAEDRDNVVCFMCGKQLSEWEKEDDPFEIHYEKCGENCAWATLRCGLREDMDKHGRFIFPNKTRMPTTKYMEKARQETFNAGNGWPHDKTKGHGASSKKVAQAGFIYTPQTEENDLVTCLYCGVALSGWDEDDDPMEEHRTRVVKKGISCAFFISSEPKGKGQHSDFVATLKNYDGGNEDFGVPSTSSVRTPKKPRAPGKGAKTPRSRKTVVTDDDEDQEEEEQILTAKSKGRKRKSTRSRSQSVAPTLTEAEEEEGEEGKTIKIPRKGSRKGKQTKASDDEAPSTVSTKRKGHSRTRSATVDPSDTDDVFGPSRPTRGRKTSKATKPPPFVITTAEGETAEANTATAKPRGRKPSKAQKPPPQEVPATSDDELAGFTFPVKGSSKDQEAGPSRVPPAAKPRGRVVSKARSVVESDLESEPPAPPPKRPGRKVSKASSIAPSDDEAITGRKPESSATAKRHTRSRSAAYDTEALGLGKPPVSKAKRGAATAARSVSGSSTTANARALAAMQTDDEDLGSDVSTKSKAPKGKKAAKGGRGMALQQPPQTLTEALGRTTAHPSPVAEVDEEVHRDGRVADYEDMEVDMAMHLPPVTPATSLKGKSKDSGTIKSTQSTNEKAAKQRTDETEDDPSPVPLKASTSRKPPSKLKSKASKTKVVEEKMEDENPFDTSRATQRSFTDQRMRSPSPPPRPPRSPARSQRKSKEDAMDADEPATKQDRAKPPRSQDRVDTKPTAVRDTQQQSTQENELELPDRTPFKPKSRSRKPDSPVTEMAHVPAPETSRSKPESANSKDIKKKKLSKKPISKTRSEVSEDERKEIKRVVEISSDEERERERGDQAKEKGTPGRHLKAKSAAQSENKENQAVIPNGDVEMREAMPIANVPTAPSTPIHQVGGGLPKLVMPAAHPTPGPAAGDASTPFEFFPFLSQTPHSDVTSLSEEELDMSVEEWIRYRIEIEYEKFKKDGERAIEEFLEKAEQTRRAIEAL